ncbi:hypothetical protein ACWDAZ_38910, partial [Streptomyces sp. NPDC001215]
MTAPAGGAPDYNNRFFVSSAAETAGPDHEVPVGHYHQAGPIVWAEFRGGKVLIGRLVGTCDPDGTLHLAYCQALDGGTVVAGEGGRLRGRVVRPRTLGVVVQLGAERLLGGGHVT